MSLCFSAVEADLLSDAHKSSFATLMIAISRLMLSFVRISCTAYRLGDIALHVQSDTVAQNESAISATRSRGGR
jgi:hypothetical protein